MEKFEREHRYLVLKISDINEICTDEIKGRLEDIALMVERGRAYQGKPPLTCVIVESDWPEYEPTWKALEQRMTSAPQSEQTHVAVAESHCVWVQDSDGPWNTSCGHVFEFIDGGPHENGATWCQYCGGKLLPQYHDTEQESVERNAALLRAATGKESEHGKR